MKLGKTVLFIFLPLVTFFYFFPIPAFLAKYIIAQEFDNLKIKNAIFILPLYNSLIKDGLLKMDIKINPISENMIISNLKTKNIIVNYQGFSMNFKNGEGIVNGNYKRLNFVYNAYGDKARLHLKGYFLISKRYLYVDGKLNFNSLKFPIRYKGNIEKLVKDMKW